MNPLPDRRSSSVIGYPTLNGYPDGKGAAPAVAPAPAPAPGLYPLPYQGGPICASPYQSYPNPPPAGDPKDFSSQSFGDMWYPSGKYDRWWDEPSNSQKFTRLMFAMVVTLLISLSMASLVIWLLFGVDVPDFQVASFSVSNLTISSSMIQATWTANLTVTNPNPELKVSGGALKASVLYKDYPLAMAAIEPTYTQARNQGLNQVNLYFKMQNEKSLCKEDLAAEVTEAEKAGVFLVSLRIAAESEFVSHTGWSQDTLRVFCEDLKLLITAKGEGKLAEDSPRGCLIFT